jgi:tungstate transport system substrate-binding protein
MVKRLFVALMACLIAVPALAQERFITVASTTSTEQSGLFKHLLPRFTEATGIEVRVVAVGTGQALRLGENGDADVVFVHDTKSEEKFVANGFGVDRRPVMYNDFVLVGPIADPAGIKGGTDVAAALVSIAKAEAPFASRGDDSGTHKAEKRLWTASGVTPAAPWYRETGSGMGPTLNMAAGIGGYALTDRGTWLNFKNRQDLAVLVEGDRRLANPYGVMLVNPARHAHVKEADARAFIDWLTGSVGQDAIASYTINGEQLFFPDAKATN